MLQIKKKCKKAIKKGKKIYTIRMKRIQKSADNKKQAHTRVNIMNQNKLEKKYIERRN